MMTRCSLGGVVPGWGSVRGGENSCAVAATPMQPTETGQLNGYTITRGESVSFGSMRGVHVVPPSCVASMTGLA